MTRFVFVPTRPPHTGVAADAGEVVAEGDVDLGEHRRAGAEIEEVHAGRDLAPHIVR
jgi:hypothetical protein